MIDIQRILAETFVARAEHHASVASTNDCAAKSAIGECQDLPLLIIADQQTAGRGRGANRWWTGEGALAFSLLLDGNSENAGRTRAASSQFPGRSPLVALAVALAVIDTVAPLAPEFPVGLHWPNDVFAAGRKVAGILIEWLANGRLVIGVGVNSNNTMADAPAELLTAATTLRDLRHQTCDQTDLLVSLLQNLQRELCRCTTDPRSTTDRADGLCLQRGRELVIRWETRSVAGRCVGIAADGAILLQTPAGRESFYSGVVSGCDAP